jgi:hypothetical protein
MMNYLRLATVVLMLTLPLSCPTVFADGDKEPKPPKLFEDNSELKVVLSGPWRTLRRNVKDDVLYPVQLTYTGPDGQQHTFDAEVAPRGITRRLRVCKFPPLKIHFDKKKMKGTLFRGNTSLKLVTYCQDRDKYEQYYIKEFLVYRIYNLLTEYSFRVRPMMIEYRDSERDDDPVTRFGFLIEDIDDVAKRNDAEKLTIPSIAYRNLDPVVTNRLSIFQFMIGNLDWAATGGPKEDQCCHNSRLIGAGNDAVPVYAVPYDFDSSGLVNAHYAAPPNELKMRNLRQRLYRGFCAFNDQLPQTAALMNDKRADIIGLFENDRHLDDGARKDAIRYLEGFYDILNDPRKFESYITDKCRGKG